MRQAQESGESRSIREFGNFRRYWSRSAEYPEENFGNNHIWMPISAVYRWADGRSEMTFRSTLRAFVGSGPDDGTIDIDDTPKVKIEDFHLRFVARYQEYRYDKSDHSLVISASSPKMGGAYSVKVMPTIRLPISKA